MARERLSMRKITEVLRLNQEGKLSARTIARSCKLARSTVAEYLRRFRVTGLTWPVSEGLDDEKLEKLLFQDDSRGRRVRRSFPDMVYIREELRRKHVTLQLLWEEYREREPQGYSYSQYCQHYREWVGKLAVSLRQEHRAGEKLFVDYAGDTIPIHDQNSGQITEGHLFVAVLGCSNYTYAEITPSERLAEWIGAQVRALEFMGGVPQIVVPDNTKSAVTNPCWYDPDINPTYLELAEHYGFAVIPARIKRPKDKAKVEAGVLIAERWILAALRDYRFFSLGEANAAVKPLLQRLNEHSFKKLPGNRREAFERLDRPALKPLPARRYEFGQWKKVCVNIDYHVEVDGHYYSVPYPLIRRELMARYTARTVELFYKSRRVAAHERSYLKGHHTTLEEHRPPAHREYLAWTPERVLQWASTIGPNCGAAAQIIMQSRAIPEQAFRPCLGLIRLGKSYGNQRVDQACQRALKLNIVGYKHIATMLKTGRDQMPLVNASPEHVVINHANVRGAEYYQ
jgi:transposase